MDAYEELIPPPPAYVPFWPRSVSPVEDLELSLAEAGRLFRLLIAQEHALGEYKKAKAVAIVFTCNHCPVAQMYEDRLIALQKEFQDKGVQFVAVNSNSVKVVAADSFEKMKERAQGKDLGGWRTEKGPFNFPYLHDATQKMARDYGAKVTPHVFVLDKDRKVVYIGAVDDNNNAEKAEKHYLRDALAAVLAGEKPPEESTKARGCSVKYEK